MAYTRSPSLAIEPSRHWIGLFVAITALGCGNDDSNKKVDCYLGDEQSCTTDDGCVGARVCGSNGWGECFCTDGNLGGASFGGAGSGANLGVAGTSSRPALGTACALDLDCPPGAACLLPNSTAWFGGGPPRGLCVADCSKDATACRHFDASVCVTVDASTSPTGQASAFCLPFCDLAAGTKDAFTCRNVPSSACDILGGQTVGYCRPFCSFDTDCATGFCDRRYGTCVSAQPAAGAVSFGERCSPDAANCNGVCLDLSHGSNVCTSRCRAGDPGECATTTESPRQSVCAYAVSSAPHQGNVGYCTELCDCDANCSASGFVCKPFAQEETRSYLGRQGFCSPPVDTLGLPVTGIACRT